MYDETVIEGLKRLDREVNDIAISKAIGRIEEADAENARLRELLYKTTRTPFGLCNFSHLHNGSQCGECEACEHTKEVMKSVREALGGDDE